MHRKTTKFRKRAELSLIYTLMALAVVGVVAVLILVMQGYRFNKYDGKIEQGGLLQYDSQPDGGTVFIDDLKLANQTPNKITASAGAHTVKMTKPGYVEWKKDVVVKPGGILWLNYTRFIPENRSASAVVPFDSISDTAISRDKKHLVVKENAASPEVSLVNLDTDKPEKTVITFAEDTYTKATDPASGSFTIEEWDRDNRYVLMNYTFDGKTEWLVLDTRDKKIVNNITMSTGVDIRAASFAYANNRLLYALTSANELRRIDLGSNIVSAPLIANVQEFSQYDRSTVVFTTLLDATTKKRSVGYLTNGAKTPRLLETYADDGQGALRLSLGRYYNETYATIAYGDTVDIMKGDLPASDSADASTMKQVARMSVPGGVKYLGFSPDENRQVYAQGASQMVTYDLELDKASTISFAHQPGERIRWVDRYHFVTVAGGEVMLYEFDGQNATRIVSESLALPADFSPNNKYMYVFTAQNGKPTLSRVLLQLQD